MPFPTSSGARALGTSATLRDVARAAGVSTASASRALAHPELVSPGLRARIEAAAARLGYVPNLAARTLSARRSGVVGMLARTLEEPVTAALVTAIDQQLAQVGFGVVIAITGRVAGAPMLRARELLARGVDAVLCLDPQLSPEGPAFAAAHAVPWIELDELGSTEASPIARRGIELACRYLLSLGHERFGALVAGNPSLAQTMADALAGTPATLVLAEGAARARSDDQGPGALSTLLEQPDRPTAFVCGSDLEAVALLRECHAHEIRVPREMSVVGFGDSKLALHAWPALTSVRVSTPEMAAQMVGRFLAARGGASAEFARPTVKLVIRESSGAPPAQHTPEWASST